VTPRPRAIEQDNATGAVSYWEAADNQSLADRNGVSLADYIHAIYAFLRQAKARRVLMIGGGGGTLATMLTRMGVAVDMVDIDPMAFEIARRYFCLPAKVRCHVGDGLAFLKASDTHYDGIVLDAFSDEIIPRHFLTARFFALVKAHMSPRGVFLINMVVKDDDDRAPDRVGWRLRETFGQARLLDTDGWEDRNAIVCAGAVRGLKKPRLLQKPASGAKALAADLRILDFRALRV
jgi:hypothetical protein